KEIIDEAAKRFGTRPSFDREERENALDKLEEDFDDLDSRFYKLDSTVNITDRIADYILKNKIAFNLRGTLRYRNKNCTQQKVYAIAGCSVKF
ncbi:DMP19 family protein, partial [Chryseosolibacter indicus]